MNGIKEEFVGALLREQNYIREVKDEWVALSEDDPSRLLVKLMKMLVEKGITPTRAVMIDQLRDQGLEYLIEHLEWCLSIPEGRSMEYLIEMLLNGSGGYNNLQSFRILNEGMKMLHSAGSTAMSQWVENEMKTCLVRRNVQNQTAERAVPKVFEQLKEVYSGRKRAYWKTGYTSIDQRIPFAPRQVVLWAGKQKGGKTRVVWNLVNRMLDNHPELELRMFHWEMSASEVVSLEIARNTGINTNVIKGLKGRPNDKDFEAILMAEDIIARRNMTLYAKPLSVEDTRQEIEATCTERSVVVIDNIGLFSSSSGISKGNEQDDHLASQLLQARDNSGALIIGLHHLSKAVDHWANKDNLYEPAISHLRGSARLADYANTVVMQHRVAMYPDLESVLGPEKWRRAQNQFSFRVIGRDIEGELTEVMEHDLGCCRIRDIVGQ